MYSWEIIEAQELLVVQNAVFRPRSADSLKCTLTNEGIYTVKDLRINLVIDIFCNHSPRCN